MPDLRLEAVSKRFMRANVPIFALREITLEVKTGEFVAIMGPSGSGKTTLLQLIGGLDRATSGSIRVGEQALETLSEAALARYRLSVVGQVFQPQALLPTLSASENVALPLLLSGASPERARRKALDLLKTLGLGERLEHYPNELSGGEVQRVSMARALITDPPLLLADEPTGNLDSKATQDIMQLLFRLPRQDKTLLIVTHDAKVAAYAERIVQLKNGYLTGAAVYA